MFLTKFINEIALNRFFFLKFFKSIVNFDNLNLIEYYILN